MQRIFEAILKGNHLEWADEVPQQGDIFSGHSLRPIRVYVTLQEEDSLTSDELRRKK